MESPTKKKKNDHPTTDEFLNPFSPFPMSPFGFTSSTPITAMMNNEGGITPFLGMTPSIAETHIAPSSRDWTPTMREHVTDGFDLQHAMSPPINKQRSRTKRDAHGNSSSFGSPLFPDLTEADALFDTEAQTHLNKNKEALANRIKATETSLSKPNFPQSKKTTQNTSNNNSSYDSNRSSLMNEMKATLAKSSLFHDSDIPSTTTTQYKYGIAEKSIFSLPDSLPSSQNSDHSGLAALTGAAETVQLLNPLPPVKTLEIVTSLPSPIVKTAISHPKKLRLKTKDDPDFSAPSSPLKPLSSTSSQPKPAMSFSRNDSLSSQNNVSLNMNSSITPYRAPSLNTMEEKVKFEEILQMGIARAAQQRADDSKTVTCNCKKSKCLKMYCDCFRLTEYCKKTCNCFECNNLEAYDDARQLAIRSITERNPEAFKPRVTEDTNNNSKGHLTGCHCRKSACLKKYCECFTGNVPCTNRCRCIECKNVQELYHFDESVRKQVFSFSHPTGVSTSAQKTLTGSGGSNNRSSSAGSRPSLPLSSKVRDVPNTRLVFSDAQGNVEKVIVDSENSNLTTSTLYSTDGDEQQPEQGGNRATGSEGLSVSVSPHKYSKYKSMTSPELKVLASSQTELRNTVDSVGSESTNNTERSAHADSTPSSPIKVASAMGNNDALLSPIKLLELADVCSERQSQEQEKDFILSTQMSGLTDDQSK